MKQRECTRGRNKAQLVEDDFFFLASPRPSKCDALKGPSASGRIHSRKTYVQAGACASHFSILY